VVIFAAAPAAISIGGVASAHTLASSYSVQALISDSPNAAAPAADTSLVNGWGLAAGPTPPWWAANNGTNTSTLYNGAGAKQAVSVAVSGGPTGDRVRERRRRRIREHLVLLVGACGGKARPLRVDHVRVTRASGINTVRVRGTGRAFAKPTTLAVVYGAWM
jgi:hypothetical protein